ncbi:MAG TPA: VOC family protein [Actinomycetota bacterium]|nr:VOC family protein [Actinomycetota bacterium]
MGNPVIHFEINGPDPELVAKFYAELFGWHTQSFPEMSYTTIETHSGRGINGGISKADKPYSTVYVGAEDLQATLDRAVSLGGTATVPVSDIPNVGTFAQFADPDGNLIGLFKARQGDQPPASEGSNPPADWFEIYGRDPARLWTFYRDLFGWTINERSGEGFVYGEVDTGAGQGINGGITANPVKEPGIVIWAQAADLKGYLDRAVSLGGTAMLPPTEVSAGLTVTMFSDPQGTVSGVYSSAR